MFKTISRKFSDYVNGHPTRSPYFPCEEVGGRVEALHLTGSGLVRNFDGDVPLSVFMIFEVTPFGDKDLIVTGRFTIDVVSHRFDMVVRTDELFDVLRRLTT